MTEYSKLIILDPPASFEFTFDLQAWQTGHNFRGIKDIPNGLHFLSCAAISSSVSVKTGCFAWFKDGEILVKKWNQKDELLEKVDIETTERVISNLNHFEPHLGPFPVKRMGPEPTMDIDEEQVTEDIYGTWISLTNYISSQALDRIFPPGYPLSPMASTSRYSDISPSKFSDQELFLKFTPFDLKRSFPPGSNGANVTRYSLDKSWLLSHLLQTEFNNSTDLFLGELQLSFLIFFVGEVFDGFEHWKDLVSLICQCEEILEYKAEFMTQVVQVILDQVKALPHDFFPGENFLPHIVKNLALNQHDFSGPLPILLKDATNALIDVVDEKFDRDLRRELHDIVELDLPTNADPVYNAIDEDIYEQGDFAPTVVELEDDT